MRTAITRIGNSRGIRIPKPLLEQSGLDGEVELEAHKGQIIIRSVTKPRAGWEEAFRRMAEHGDDRLLDGDAPMHSTWDNEEWQW